MSPFDETERREIKKALVIAGLSAVLAALVNLVAEEVRERRRVERANRSDK